MEPPTEDARGAHCLVQPKEEVADDLGITYDCEEDIESVSVTEEWCDISQQLDSGVSEQDRHVSEQDCGVSEQDGGVSEQGVVMVMPIKTELTLSDDLARLHTRHQLAEHGSVPQVLKVEWKPKAEADVAADCASTCVAPLSVKLATNRGNKVQAEEADTVQKSEQVLEIYNDEPDKRSCDTSGVTNISSLANCVVKLYDVFKTPNKILPLPNESFVIAQRAATAVSMDLKQVASHIEDKGPVTNKMNVNNRIASKTSQSEANFSNVDTSGNSLRTHTCQKYYCCKLCKYKSTHDYLLSRHMRTHTGEKPHVCELCDYRFARKSDLLSHMKSHTDENRYICELCDYKCAIKSKLVRHMRKHSREKPYICKLCDFRFANKWHLVSHSRTHTGEKPFCCDVCDYRCSRKFNLVRHRRIHTGEKPYLCNLCDYKCAQKSILVSHRRTHSGEKPYLCKLCNYKCVQKCSLVSHMRLHTGEIPYLCKLCDYRCARKSYLVRHMRSHTESPMPKMGLQNQQRGPTKQKELHRCKVCEKHFKYKSVLMTHMRVHTGEKPFTCKQCQKKFTNKRSLTNHRAIHTDEQIFSCVLCPS